MDLNELEKAARAAEEMLHSYQCSKGNWDKRVMDDFTWAASPEAILELCHRVRVLEKEHY
jgi:hypothetical protein